MAPRAPHPPMDPAALRAAVAGATTIAGVLRLLGLPDSGATRRCFHAGVIAAGISVDHFVGQGHHRGTVSPRRKGADAILRRLEAGSGREKTALLRRALDERGVPHVCALCGTGEVWQGRRLVLEVDHVSGDRLDNRQENLRYLCPSCHSQTATFAGRARTQPLQSAAGLYPRG